MATTIATAFTGTASKMIGKVVGNTVINAMFKNERINNGKRLTHINIPESPEGQIIPNVYGKVKLNGSIIWMSDVGERVKTRKKKTKTETITYLEYNYTVSLAIGLCEGEISSVGKIWADDVLISNGANSSSVRIYLGKEDQEADPLLEALYDEDAPRFRGLAYVIIQELDISQFGNKIPQFSCEVTRYSKDKDSIETLVESMIIIPGCGEFVYDTKVQNENIGSEIISVNQHQKPAIANARVSLEQLKATFPNVMWVAPVVCWFVDNLTADYCNVVPKIEKRNIQYESEEWNVAGVTRQDAAEVLRIGDQLNYGGTPNDASIVRYLEYIKSQGLKIMFYPMIFVDLAGKPWRGKINALTADGVKHFFNGENGYNKFILHYANLVKDYADAFLIGSEMQDLTKFKDENGEYVAVNEFIKLAEKVKEVIGEKVKISYAANWGEYHSINGEYYMDQLWASKFIDFIGIDAYFPLTDTTRSQYDVNKIMEGWNSGELYDFYYEDGKKMPLSKDFAMKNIEHWWSNKHYNSDGKITDWKPKMKKIWFTEYGFASVSCTTNEPNVFVDDSSDESKLPKNSNGEIDFLAQRAAIHATEMRWKNSDMVERKFLWTWDARPYPAWPRLGSVWTDGKNWERGHWINGKAGVMELKSVVRDICLRSGVPDQLIDVENLHGIVHGMVIDRDYSARDILEDLQKVYNFDSVEVNGKLTFISRSVREIKEIKYDELLYEYKLNEIDDGYKASPISIEVLNNETKSISLHYIGEHLDVKKYEFYSDECHENNLLEFSFPIVISEDDVRIIAHNILSDIEDSKTTYEFTLSINSLFKSQSSISIIPGDIVKMNVNGEDFIMKILNLDIKADNTVKVTSSKTSAMTSRDIKLSSNGSIDNEKLYEFIPQSDFSVVRIPGTNTLAIVASGINKKWYGCQVNYKMISRDSVLSEDALAIEQPTIIGQVLSYDGLEKENYFSFDNYSKLVIKLHHGQLFSIAKNDLFFSEKNMVVVGDEIIKFSSAKLQPDGTYVISGLLRGLYGTRTEKFDKFIVLDEQSAKMIELEKGVDKIDINVKTFFDKKRVTGSEELQHKEFTVGHKLIPPVNLVMKNNQIHWTPCIASNDLFVDQLNHFFYVQFLDENSNIFYRLHTGDSYCTIPKNHKTFTVMIAAFQDNKIESRFISRSFTL